MANDVRPSSGAGVGLPAVYLLEGGLLTNNRKPRTMCGQRAVKKSRSDRLKSGAFMALPTRRDDEQASPRPTSSRMRGTEQPLGSVELPFFGVYRRTSRSPESPRVSPQLQRLAPQAQW
jgi:hypothetical protein